MWDSPGDYQAYRNQITLATGGNDYGPQNGPAEPHYDEPPILACGCSSEDTDGVDCGHYEINYAPDELPEEQITEDDIDLKERDS